MPIHKTRDVIAICGLRGLYKLLVVDLVDADILLGELSSADIIGIIVPCALHQLQTFFLLVL